jgi:PAS fold.
LCPNGGSSIKDSLDRIEDKQHFFGSFLKTQLNAHNKALFEASATGECIWINRPHARMTGFTTNEMMGHGWVNAIAPECRKNFKLMWDKSVALGAEFDEDVWYIKPDGVTRYKVHVHAYIIQNRDGGPAGYLGEVTELGQTSTEPVDCAHTV